MSKTTDLWAAEDFENKVASALIACYETKLRPSKGMPKQWHIGESTMSAIRLSGPYIPAGDRVVASVGPGAYNLDLDNDFVPEAGIAAFRRPADHIARKDNVEGYIHILYFRREAVLPHNWKRLSGGKIFSLRSVTPGAKGIFGDVRYFTVSDGGEVLACDFYGFPAAGEFMSKADPALYRNTTELAFFAMQWVIDRRFCWAITAKETSAIAHVGCAQEEIKSLLYARSLPMTATGRKRPILHVVEAHKRRMKSGTDVEVGTFLRGQQAVEIGGTMFHVNPPAVMRNAVSKMSRDRYFGEVKEPSQC